MMQPTIDDSPAATQSGAVVLVTLELRVDPTWVDETVRLHFSAHALAAAAAFRALHTRIDTSEEAMA